MTSRSQLPPEHRPRDSVLLGLLTLAALALRWLGLERGELFVDEAATWWYAGLVSMGELGSQVQLEPTPPLYYGLIAAVLSGLGESDFWLRLPSALFGAATVPAVYGLGRALAGLRVGWPAALLIALHPLHVFYSREARVYTLLALLSVLVVLALWRALGHGSVLRWALLAVLLTLACYAHFYGLFVLSTCGFAILLLARGRERWRGLGAVVLAGLLFAPYLLYTLPHLESSQAAWSIERLYERWPEERRLDRVLDKQLIGADYPPFLRHLARPPTPPLLRRLCQAAQAALLLAALISGLRPGRRRLTGLLLAFWLALLLIPWAVSHFRPLYHPGRHDVYVLGPVCVLLAMGFAALWSGRRVARALAVVCALVLAFGAGTRLLALHFVPLAQGERAAGAWLGEKARAEDRVVALGIRRLTAERYATLAGAPTPFSSFPESTDRHPGWADPRALLADPKALAQEAEEQVAALGGEGPRTVFVLTRAYPRTADAVSESWLVDRHLFAALERAGWRRQPELELEDGRVMAFKRAPRMQEAGDR